MPRPRMPRPRPEPSKPLSLRDQARLKALRDELWDRCICHMAMVERMRRAAGLPPEPDAP